MTTTLQFVWYLLFVFFVYMYALLDGYFLGVGILYPVLPRDKAERAAMRGSVGPTWDGNEVWLLGFGGALYGAFPVIYASVFSGLYVLVMITIWAFILRAVSIEYRARDPKWVPLWDAGIFLGNLVPAFGFGMIVGNLIRGFELDPGGRFTGGLLSLLNGYALLFGFLAVALFAVHGAAWTMVKTEGALYERARRTVALAGAALAMLLVAATIWSAASIRESFDNTLARPAGWVAIAAIAAGFVLAQWAAPRRRDWTALVGSGLTIAGVIGIWAVGNYPNLVPAVNDPANSLTLAESSSSRYGLITLLVLTAMTVPVILLYQAWTHRVFRDKVHGQEVEY